MTEFRKTLVDRMIRLYGFEHRVVIAFSGLCERYPDSKVDDKSLEILVEAHEEYPILD